jgi:hypothetical protein
MKVNKIILFLFLISNFYSCNQKTNSTKNQIIKLQKSKAEDFDTFINKFYTDSLFQINRIVFPLESETDSVMNKKNLEEKDPKTETDTSNFTTHNKSNWMMLITDRSFRKDSILIVDGIKYIRRFHKTEKYVEESILYADPEYVFMKVKYKLINGKWYLVDYQNELDNERS